MSAALVAAASVTAAVLLLPHRGARARARLADERPGTCRAGDGEEGDVAALAERLAGVALAGLPPTRAWAVLARRPGPHAALAAEVIPWLEAGVPPGRALRAVALRPAVTPARRPELACVAVALDACERAGAPLAPALEALAAALRADLEARRDRETALAAPRSTAAVMTALPAVGLLLGLALGVNPIGVLLGTGPGRLALVLGVALWVAGRRWTARLVAHATP